MINSTKLKGAAAAAAAVAVTVTMAGPAHADQQPRGTDVVGVGSDTVQYVSDFLDDGDALGNPGYNQSALARRVWSFDATADSNGRAAYSKPNGGSALDSRIVVRAGAKPIVRPNGSGGGITALLADTKHQIDFVRSSRLPTAGEQSTASSTAGFGAGIHVYKIATDGLDIAVATTTNAPAGLSKAEIVKIYDGTYKTWNQIPGYTGTSTAAIVPVLPQASSGTGKDFLADLKAANGGTTVTLASTVVTSEEHDPSAIAGNPNAIGPFSTGRDKLIDSNYFNGVPAPNTIKLLANTAPDNAASYHLNRTLYILVREADVNSTKGFQPGSTVNFVNALFGTPDSWYAQPDNSALFDSAGVTQSWDDLGLAQG